MLGHVSPQTLPRELHVLFQGCLLVTWQIVPEWCDSSWNVDIRFVTSRDLSKSESGTFARQKRCGGGRQKALRSTDTETYSPEVRQSGCQLFYTPFSKGVCSGIIALTASFSKFPWNKPCSYSLMRSEPVKKKRGGGAQLDIISRTLALWNSSKASTKKSQTDYLTEEMEFYSVVHTKQDLSWQFFLSHPSFCSSLHGLQQKVP